MKKRCIMHIHFWGDVREQAGSVDKVLEAFSRMDDAGIEVEIASLGEDCSALGFEERQKIRQAALATASRFSAERINGDLAALYNRYLSSRAAD